MLVFSTGDITLAYAIQSLLNKRFGLGAGQEEAMFEVSSLHHHDDKMATYRVIGREDFTYPAVQIKEVVETFAAGYLAGVREVQRIMSKAFDPFWFVVSDELG